MFGEIPLDMCQIFCSFPFYMWLSENFLLSPLVKSKPTPLNSSSFKDTAQAKYTYSTHCIDLLHCISERESL
jgi:hypothetical protein